MAQISPHSQFLLRTQAEHTLHILAGTPSRLPGKLDIVVLPPSVSEVIARRLESNLLQEAPDPDRSRQLLIERAECGPAWP